jgi:hypothetical protein
MSNFIKKTFVSAALVSSLFGAVGCSGLQGEKYPTPEELRKETGYEVYVFPGEDATLKQVGEFCILVGSTDEKGVWGKNPHDSVCNTGGLADLDQFSYSEAEFSEICRLAKGTDDWVAKPGSNGVGGANLEPACVTSFPIS